MRPLALLLLTLSIALATGCRDRETPHLERSPEEAPPTRPDPSTRSPASTGSAARSGLAITYGFTDAAQRRLDSSDLPDGHLLATRQVAETLETRLHELGHPGATVDPIGTTISVWIPGVDASFDATGLLATGRLELRLGAGPAAREQLRQAALAVQNTGSGPFQVDAAGVLTGDLAGAATYPLSLPADTRLAFEPQADPDAIAQPTTRWRVHLLRTDVDGIDGRSVADAWPATGVYDEPEVGIRFDEAATARLAELTTDHVGDVLAVLVDGEVLMAPVIRDAITGGEVSIHFGVDGTWERATALALQFRSGALPEPLEERSRQVLPGP